MDACVNATPTLALYARGSNTGTQELYALPQGEDRMNKMLTTRLNQDEDQPNVFTERDTTPDIRPPDVRPADRGAANR